MFRNMQLRKAAAELDKDFYLKCFLSPQWSSVFDLNFHDPNIDKEQYINQKIYADYPDLIRLIVYDAKTHKKILFANILIDDNTTTKRCSLIGGVNPDLVGKGYGSFGLYLSLKFIFSVINMNKVTCQVYDFNFPSFNMLKNASFQLEGVLRQHAFNYTNQKFVDVKVYSMLASEFANSRVYQAFEKMGLNEGFFLCQET